MEDFFPLLLVVLYFVFRAITRKNSPDARKKAAGGQLPGGTAPPVGAPATFAEAMRQIQQAMQERTAQLEAAQAQATAQANPSRTSGEAQAAVLEPRHLLGSRGVQHRAALLGEIRTLESAAPEGRVLEGAPLDDHVIERDPHEEERFGIDQQGFGADNPFAETAFASGLNPEHGLRQHAGHDNLHNPPPSPSLDASAALRERLRQPASLREALILGEILGAPRGRRG